MLHNRKKFFDKYMNFCHDEIESYGYYTVTSVIFAFKNFMKENFPGIDNETKNKIREELFNVEVWLLNFEYKFKEYLEGAVSLDGRMIYQTEQEFLYDVINKDNVVIVNDDCWDFVAIEKEDIDEVKSKVAECMKRISSVS